MFSQHLLIIIVIIYSVKCEQISGYKVIDKILNQCASADQMINCLKIQAIKITNRAIQSKSLNIIDGVSLTHNNNRHLKNIHLDFNEKELQNLGSEKLDNLLENTSSR